MNFEIEEINDLTHDIITANTPQKVQTAKKYLMSDCYYNPLKDNVAESLNNHLVEDTIHRSKTGFPFALSSLARIQAYCEKISFVQEEWARRGKLLSPYLQMVITAVKDLPLDKYNDRGTLIVTLRTALETVRKQHKINIMPKNPLTKGDWKPGSW